MMIRVRDEENKLLAKDILGITLDLEVMENGENEYELKINSRYILDEKFETIEEAERQLIYLADSRNRLEEELQNY